MDKQKAIKQIILAEGQEILSSDYAFAGGIAGREKKYWLLTKGEFVFSAAIERILSSITTFGDKRCNEGFISSVGRFHYQQHTLVVEKITFWQ